MSVTINGIVIPEHLIEMFAGYMNGVIFSGKALEAEGKKINDALSAYKKGDVVQIKDYYKFQYSGIFEVDSITLSLDASKAPAIYSFRLDLKYR